MDNLIEAYLQETFHPDLVDTMRKAFRLMDDFDLPNYEDEYLDLLMMEDMDLAQNIQDHFTTLLHKHLDAILQFHLITPMESTHLFEKTELVSALYQFQHLIDYAEVLHALEGDYDPEERFAQAMSQCCELTPLGIENMLWHMNPSIVESMISYIYNKQSDTSTILTDKEERNRKIVSNVRLFKSFLETKPFNFYDEVEALGIHMLSANALPGQALTLYVPFVDAQLKHTNYGKLAVDLYSLLILSAEGFDNPVDTFKKNSGWLMDDLLAISKTDPLFMMVANAFDKYKLKLTMEKDNS